MGYAMKDQEAFGHNLLGEIASLRASVAQLNNRNHESEDEEQVKQVSSLEALMHLDQELEKKAKCRSKMVC